MSSSQDENASRGSENASRQRIDWVYWSDFDSLRERTANADLERYGSYPHELPQAIEALRWLMVRFDASASTDAAPLILPHLGDAEMELEAIRSAMGSLDELLATSGFTDEDLEARANAFKTAVDAFAVTVGAMPSPDGSGLVGAARDEIQRVRSSAGQHIRQLDRAFEEARTKASDALTEALAEVSSKEEETRADLAELASKIELATTGFDTTAGEMRDGLNNVKGQITALEQSLATRGDEALTKLKTESDAAVAAIDTLREEHEAACGAQIAALTKKSELALQKQQERWSKSVEQREAAHRRTMEESAAVLADAKKTLT